MFKYGLELEGFFKDKDGNVLVPAEGMPTDGFPGLVEIQSAPTYDLYAALGELYGKLRRLTDIYGEVDVDLHRHKFTREQMGILRTRYTFKEGLDIRNLYGKAPKRLNNWTIASAQINISNPVSEAYITKEGIHIPERYGLLDIPKIIKALDTEFAAEITRACRQPGEYCIKDNFVRLEYRSLPNFAIDDNFVKRVLKALKK